MDTINSLRENIDSIDNSIIDLLNSRFSFCETIGVLKKANNIPTVYDPAREQTIINRLSLREKYPGMVEAIWPVIMNFSKDLQK